MDKNKPKGAKNKSIKKDDKNKYDNLDKCYCDKTNDNKLKCVTCLYNDIKYLVP